MPIEPKATEDIYFTGIFQSDILIRGAIIAAIQDLRAKPWLLGYVFAGLPRDKLTAEKYGGNEVARATEWFMNTKLPVHMDTNLKEDSFPCITITLSNSNEVEAESTLGDVHYHPRAQNNSEWPILAGPFTLTSYDPTTGKVVVDADSLKNFIIVPGHILIDKRGGQHPILEVDDNSNFFIETNCTSDLNQSILKGQKPYLITHVESARYRETYTIGCHVTGEPVHLTYLHSIVVFCLLRYKESLLEERGFERSVVSSQMLRLDNESLPTTIFSRYLSISGTVSQYWPKIIAPTVDAVVADIAVSTDGFGSGRSPTVTDIPDYGDEDDEDEEDSWPLKP